MCLVKGSYDKWQQLYKLISLFFHTWRPINNGPLSDCNPQPANLLLLPLAEQERGKVLQQIQYKYVCVSETHCSGCLGCMCRGKWPVRGYIPTGFVMMKCMLQWSLSAGLHSNEYTLFMRLMASHFLGRMLHLSMPQLHYFTQICITWLEKNGGKYICPEKAEKIKNKTLGQVH